MLLRVFFYGMKAHEGKNNTRLLFNSNLHGNICCFARQKGLFSNYGKDFKNNGRQVNLPVTERLEFLKMLRHDIYHLGMGIDIDDGEWKEKYVAEIRKKADAITVENTGMFSFICEILGQCQTDIYDRSSELS